MPMRWILQKEYVIILRNIVSIKGKLNERTIIAFD